MVFPVFDTLTDSAQINWERMQLQRPAFDAEEVVALVAGAVADGRKITAFGKRHSQGHQVLLADAVALDLEALQGVAVTQLEGVPCVRVGCGALWDHVHNALVRHQEHTGVAYAPCTHQSSPYFSVGGSLAVNCHGRDPRQPPLADTVLQLSVLKADGRTVVTANRQQDRALFETVLGGYGAGGLMLEAWIRLKHEAMLRHEAHVIPIQAYLQQLSNRVAGHEDWPAMHHGWLNFSRNNDMFREVLAVDSIALTDPVTGDLTHEGFISDDATAQLYQYFRNHPDEHHTFWALLTRNLRAVGNGKVERTLNAMRAPVRFTGLMSTQNSDLLQEYFLPVDKVQSFLDSARNTLLTHRVNLLTSTVRVVQRDETTVLRYADGGPRICVVFNVNVPKSDCRPAAGAAASVFERWTQELVEAALSAGGSFYLPYFRAATASQMQRAYPNFDQFSQARLAADPETVFDNGFLQHYGL